MSLKDFPNDIKHQKLSYPETIEFLQKLLKHGKIEGIVRRMTNLHVAIIKHTDFMSAVENVKMSTRIKVLLNGTTELPKCEKCGSDVNIVNKKENWFSRYCSKPCMYAERAKKTVATSRARNNGKHHNATEKVQCKRKATCKKKYGEDNWMKTPQGVQLAVENFHSDDAREKTRNTLREKYGVDSIGKTFHIFDEKRRATLNKKYENGHHSRDPEVKRKRQEKNMERYGEKEFLASVEGRRKTREAMVETYGCENYFQTEEFRERIIAHNMNVYGTPHHLQNEKEPETLLKREWCASFISEHGIDLQRMAEDSGTHMTTVIRYLEKYGLYESKERKSFSEEVIAQFLDEFEVEYVRNFRLENIEADFYIPEKRLAIECNGNYFHSEIFKDSRYHLNKTIHYQNNGIQLIHLFEDEILNNISVIKRMIVSKLGLLKERVYARNTTVSKLSPREANEFYEKYHIQGSVKASSHIGLFCGSELVAAMSFKNFGRNLKRSGDSELVRFATKVSVVGGFSKLLKNYVKSNSTITHVISYADKRISDGNVYRKNGFDLIKETSPSYFYLDKKNYLKRHRKETFKKNNLAEAYPSIFDEKLTESQNAYNAGFVRIYDCGLLKFEITRDKLGL